MATSAPPAGLGACSACKHFIGPPVGQPTGPGECHVYPPGMVVLTVNNRQPVVTNAATSVWPQVNPDDWCGQWASA